MTSPARAGSPSTLRFCPAIRGFFDAKYFPAGLIVPIRQFARRNMYVCIASFPSRRPLGGRHSRPRLSRNHVCGCCWITARRRISRFLLSPRSHYVTSFTDPEWVSRPFGNNIPVSRLFITAATGRTSDLARVREPRPPSSSIFFHRPWKLFRLAADLRDRRNRGYSRMKKEKKKKKDATTMPGCQISIEESTSS